MTKALLMEKFRFFCKENPFEFEKEQYEKVEQDIKNPRKGIVSDEYVDFTLWTKGLKSRQEYFAEYVEKLLPLEKYKKLLEVGSGRTARLSKLLQEKGYKMTSMDPQIVPENVISYDIDCIKDAFTFEQTDVTKYDAVVAQEPCEATEHIIRECVAKKKDFVISLCGVEHRLINGDMPENVYEWYDYLEKIGGDNCTLVKVPIIPGYASHVMIGIYGIIK